MAVALVLHILYKVAFNSDYRGSYITKRRNAVLSYFGKKAGTIVRAFACTPCPHADLHSSSLTFGNNSARPSRTNAELCYVKEAE